MWPNKEAGLTIYSLSSKDPRLVVRIPTDSLQGLHVMGVSQFGSRVYLALGDFFSGSQSSGMAIVNVSDPANAVITGFWKNNVETEGASMVLVDGDYAFVTGFSHGLFILDISKEQDIKLVSKYTPSLNYPDVKPDSNKINARGMVFENDVVYLCYDAGGLRIINVSDKKNPRETGRYSNPVMNKKPRAYNNIVKKDSLVYIGVDYCGMEILNVADTSNIREVSWWNPWKCEESPLKWFNSPGHVNEVQLDTSEMKLFVSTGKSDLHVVDVSDPALPDSCDMFGGVDNKVGTWGVNRYRDEIYLSYICTFIPFSSNWSGVKILKYNKASGFEPPPVRDKIRIFPNPAKPGNDLFFDGLTEQGTAVLYDVNGKVILSKTGNGKITMPNIQPGIYWLKIENVGSNSAFPIYLISD